MRPAEWGNSGWSFSPIGPVSLKMEELEGSAGGPPDLRYPHGGEDLEPIERGAGDIDFDDQVGDRIEVEVELAFAPDGRALSRNQ